MKLTKDEMEYLQTLLAVQLEYATDWLKYASKIPMGHPDKNLGDEARARKDVELCESLLEKLKEE